VKDGWIPSPGQSSPVHGRAGKSQGSHTDRLPLSRPHRQDLLRGWPWRVERACPSVYVCERNADSRLIPDVTTAIAINGP
jgi:hypothetical protein